MSKESKKILKRLADNKLSVETVTMTIKKSTKMKLIAKYDNRKAIELAIEDLYKEVKKTEN